MKKVVLTTVIIVSIVFIGVLSFQAISNSLIFYKATGEITEAEAMEAFKLLNDTLDDGRYSYFEYFNEHELAYGDDQYVADISATNYIDYEEYQLFSVDLATSGFYYIDLTYLIHEDALNNATLKILINGEKPFYEANTIDLPIQWYDASKNFILDSYGDESLPLQLKKEGVLQTSLFNNTYYTALPLMFYFEAGTNEITIENVSSSPFQVEGMTLRQPTALMDYETYKNAYNGFEQATSEPITINAIDYTSKNSSYLRLFSYDSPTVSPYDAVDKKLNIISGESWYEPGKSISFDVDVTTSGFYKLAMHHFPGKDDYMVFRSVQIDGEIPFEEAKAIPLSDTNGNNFVYETLSNQDGEAYEFYLEAGTHTITFRAESEPVAFEARAIQLIIDHINQFALNIRKITGKDIDKNRTWKLTDNIPETAEYLQAYDTLIKYIIDQTSVYAPNGAASSTLSSLEKALVKLDEMMEKPDELPLYFEDLYSGSGSVNQMLGDSIDYLTMQPLSLNEFTLYTGEMDFTDNASVLSKIGSGVEGFVASFTSDKYVVKNDDEVLNVWINRPITHVDTLQKLVDSKFTPETGIEVKISVMPDPNKLVLASAAGEAPDIAMGLLSYMPFDLAIRNAAYDLSSFEDFWTVADRFTPGAFVPYVLEDNVYALPETLEFYATVYRKDIFDSLELEVPDTWNEVTELLPELQRYGMNFYHQIAGGTSIKWFYQTSPFIYQMGGELYSEDGLRTTLDQEEAVAGMEFLTDLFTMYSMPEQELLFYNAFRYGSLPIGIADFTTYMQIKNAAPELVGNWELAPYPGIENDQGEIERWFIANGRGSIIFNDTEYPDEAWEFLKWWTSTDIQTTYGYTLQSIYGPEYLWLSGNIEAVENSSIDMADKMVILDQINWLRDVPRTPGQYMLERGLSDIWNRVVFDDVPTRIAIDRQVITINREIERKMIEFGYLDQDGSVLIPYTIRDVDWIIEQIETYGGMTDEE